MLAFQSLRVLDLTHVIAGAYCSYVLGSLGAEVIRVEPPGGDALRRRGGTRAALRAQGLATPFLAQAAGKRAVEIDLRSPAGRAAFLDLLDGADLLVQNYRPGALAALDLAPEALRARCPALVIVSVAGYGAGPAGPAAWRAYDHVVQAAAGVMAATGTPETGPLRAGPQVVDYMAGMTAAMAAAAALHRRAATGQGAVVDVPMLDCALALQGSFATDVAAGGPPPRTLGRGAASGAAFGGVHPTAEGLLAIAASEPRQVLRLRVVLAGERHPLPADDDALAAALPAMLLCAPATRWEALLNAAGVPAARVRALDEALAFQAGAGAPFLTPVALPGGGEAQVPAMPFLIDGARPAPAGPAPAPGRTDIPAWSPRSPTP